MPRPHRVSGVAPATAAVSLLALTLATAAAAPPATRVVPVPTLPFEAHSVNDLDAWPALLGVGVRFIKADLALCDVPSCGGYSTFNRTDLPYPTGSPADCVYAGGGRTVCCGCMRGDASTRPSLADPFNTTADLAGWAASGPRGVPRTATLQPGDRPLMVGLDWGGSPGCDGGLAASPPCPTLQLIAGPLLALQAGIAAHGLAMLPYGDGALAGWLLDLDAACGPASAGGGAGCTPTQRALQALPWPVVAGPPLPPYVPGARLRVPNGDWTSDLPASCRGAPGSLNASTGAGSAAPLLWYEQQDQYEFLNLLAEWAACPAAPPAYVAPSTGIVAVSNVGPAMFEVFTAGARGMARGLNTQFTANSGPGAGVLPGGLGAPLLALVGAAFAAPGVDRWAVLLTTAMPPAGANVTAPGSAAVYVLPVADGLAPAPLSAAASSATLPLAAGDAFIALAGTVGPPATAPPLSPFAVGVSSAGFVVVWTVSGATGGGADGGATYSLGGPGFPAGAVALAAAPLCTSSAPTLKDCVLLLLVAGAASGGGGSGGGGSWLNVTAVPLASPGDPPLATAAVAGSFAVRGGGAMAVVAAPGPASGAFEGLLVFAGAAPAGPLGQPRSELFAAGLTVALGGAGTGTLTVALTVARAGGGAGGGAPPTRIGFGSRPHLSALAAPAGSGWPVGTPLALLLATDSDCDGGLLLNNANFARCVLGDPASDANPLYALWQSVPGQLGYTFGALADFAALAARPPPAPGAPWPMAGALGVCHPTLAHGKVTAAVSAAGALYPVLAAHPTGARTPNGTEVFNTTTGGQGGGVVVEVGLLAVHDGALVDALQSLTLCGLPNALDGLAWDAWRVPQAPLGA